MDILEILQDLKQDLQVFGLPVYELAPQRLNSDCIVILPSDTLISVDDDESFNEYRLYIDFCLILSHGDQVTKQKEIYQLASKFLTHLDTISYLHVVEMTAPHEVNTSSGTMPAITVRTNIHILKG